MSDRIQDTNWILLTFSSWLRLTIYFFFFLYVRTSIGWTFLILRARESDWVSLLYCSRLSDAASYPLVEFFSSQTHRYFLLSVFLVNHFYHLFCGFFISFFHLLTILGVHYISQDASFSLSISSIFAVALYFFLTHFLTTSTPSNTLSRHIHASGHEEDYPVPHIQRLGFKHHQGQLTVPRIHEHKVRTWQQEIFWCLIILFKILGCDWLLLICDT